MTSNPRRLRCQRNCGRSSQSKNGARTLDRVSHTLEFIGVDGEGVTREDGSHEYVLLSVGDRSLYMSDGGRLTYHEIFPFLYECFLANPSAAYIGFALGYDFAHWFRDLTEERARMLLTEEGIRRRQRTRSQSPMPFPVYLGEWEIDILGSMRFRIRPHDGHKRAWMYICDAFSFYQSSFLVAIDPEKWPKAIVTSDEYKIIEAGKSERAIQTGLTPDMISYNVMENRVMARLMDSLNRGLTHSEIRLKRHQWFGPGQAAGAWLDKISAPRSQDAQIAIPDVAREAARKSYFAGWFDIFAHGLIPGRSYEYDLNSAYPWEISRLPCLMHGKWTYGKSHIHVKKPKREDPLADLPIRRPYQLVYAEILGVDLRSGSMLHRTPHGNVLRPNDTKGWFWRHELEAAIEAGLIKNIWVEEKVQYDPCNCPPPMREIADLYAKRLLVGKNSPEGKAIRIVINSCYGKMAQSVGQPKYANAIYASLITAGCRTKILNAIASHPKRTEDLLMVATDGVYFRSPHPTLPLSEHELGKWDMKSKDNMTLMMPGVYWDDKTREDIREGKAPKLKSRGVSARDLAACVTKLDDAFRELTRAFIENGEFIGWPEMTVPIAFSMVSPKLALARGKWDTCGAVSTSETREFSSMPGSKRQWQGRKELGPGLWSDTELELDLENDRGIIRSYPYSQWIPLESTPYDRRFGEELQAMMEGDVWGALTPDGVVGDSFASALGR